MALNGKYVSLKSIISELYGDVGFQEDVNYEDMIRWAVDALNLIGHPLQYKRVVTGFGAIPNLDIKDYKAPLPKNIHKIEQIAVNGQAARYSSNTFHHMLGGECCPVSGDSFVSNGPVSEGFYIDGFGNEFASGFFNTISSGGVTYDVNDNCLTLSVKEGKVCIAYLEFPFDGEGFPMIPEDVSYVEAVKKYITMKYDYLGWRKQPAGRGKRELYKDSQQEWEWYVGQAGATAKMPSTDQMESLKNSLVRTFKSFNQHQGFFKGLGEQQRRRIK